MRKLSFIINLLFTVGVTLFVLINYIIANNKEANIIALSYLGFFQVITSLILTLYSVVKNPKQTAFYLIYWLIVLFFFKYLFQPFFYGCIIIAFYNLYIHYCSYSNSKYNIIKS